MTLDTLVPWLATGAAFVAGFVVRGLFRPHNPMNPWDDERGTLERQEKAWRIRLANSRTSEHEQLCKFQLLEIGKQLALLERDERGG